jgi:hypothetical protein
MSRRRRDDPPEDELAVDESEPESESVEYFVEVLSEDSERTSVPNWAQSSQT